MLRVNKKIFAILVLALVLIGSLSIVTRVSSTYASTPMTGRATSVENYDYDHSDKSSEHAILKLFLAGKNIASEKHVKIGHTIYLIYTTRDRLQRTYFAEYHNGWGDEQYVGGEHAELAVHSGMIFVASIINHSPWVYYNLGNGWYSWRLSRGIASVIGVYAGTKVLVAWYENHTLLSSQLTHAMFSMPTVIGKMRYPVRSIHIDKNTISVEEEGTDEWLYQTYKTSNYHFWSLYTEHIKKKNIKITNVKSLQDSAMNRPKTRAMAKWTFLVYMDGDNSLSTESEGDISEMEEGYSNSSAAEVNLIVLWDRSGNGDTKLVKIYHGGYEDISAEASWMDSEMDMGSPSTLVDFVTWSVENYPAEHYFLDLWDHGGDYSGAMYDETSGTHLSLSDLREAALEIYHRLGFPLDIWGYDACLMDAGADNYQIKQAANIILASEHTEGDDGWDYNAIIGNLTANPSLNPEQFAYNFVEHVDDEHSRTDIVTMVAINTTRWDFWFMQAYNELAQAIRQSAGTDNSGIKKAFEYAVSADSKYWPNGKDVGDFAKELLNYVNNTKIRYWAQRLLDNVSYSVINSYDTDSDGRKIIMAETNTTSQVSSSYYIFKETEWSKMLEQVFSSGTNDNNQEPVCNITAPANGSVFLNTGLLNITGTASDPDGTVSRVEIKIDRGDWLVANGTSSWYYNLNLSNLSLGEHYIFVRAYDGDLYSLYPYITVYVRQRTDLPDLAISSTDIVFSNPAPERGKNVRIYATVHNIGNNVSYNVNVSFYIDKMDSSHLIDTVNYGTISQGANVTGNIIWNTNDYVGTHTIFVYADSTHTIDELREDNNAAGRSITIQGHGIALVCLHNVSEAAVGTSANYTISVSNIGTVQDTIDISVDNPSSWNASVSENRIVLAPGSKLNVTLTVNVPLSASQNSKAIIGVRASSEENNSVADEIYTTTWIKPQILLVDDDGGYNYQVYFENALNADGYRYDVWDTNDYGSPSISVLNSYTLVIWDTGPAFSDTLTHYDQANLTSYLRGGGRLYLSSQDFLYEISNGINGNINNSFVNNYLHVLGVNNDKMYTNISGVAGDPISGNFTNITLNYPYPNYDDEIIIDSKAKAIFTNASSGNVTADRFDSGTWRVVFTAFSFEAVENYNASIGAELMNKIVQWLLVSDDAPPATPAQVSGPSIGETGKYYYYESSTTDPNGNDIRYIFNWGDGNYTITALHSSGAMAKVSHLWERPGTYRVCVRAIDEFGAASSLSPVLDVRISTNMSLVIETPANGSTVSGFINISGYASSSSTANYDELWNLNYGTAIYQGSRAIGDATNNGKNDLLIGGRDGKLHVYEWNGSTFIEIANITDPSGESDNPAGYAIGDLTGNGKNDIAVAWDHDFSAFSWNGHDFVQIGNTWSGDGTDNSYDCAIGDVNNDGHNDVVLADDPINGDPEITVLSWTGTEWRELATWNAPNANLTTPVVKVEDVNNDGKNEIIATPGKEAVVLRWNGTALVPAYISRNLSAESYGIAVTTINSVKYIAIGLSTPTVLVYKWNGTGYREVYNKTWTGESGVMEALSAGDVSCDGVPDIVVGTNYIHILQWNGYSFSEARTINYTNMGELSVAYIGALTNDGKNDIVAGNVLADSNGEYHVRVISYSDSINKVEISIDDESFAHPLAVNGTNHWYILYNVSSLGPGYHRIYVRAYGEYGYIEKWIVINVSESVPELSSLALIMLMLIVPLAIIRKLKRE